MRILSRLIDFFNSKKPVTQDGKEGCGDCDCGCRDYSAEEDAEQLFDENRALSASLTCLNNEYENYKDAIDNIFCAMIAQNGDEPVVISGDLMISMRGKNAGIGQGKDGEVSIYFADAEGVVN